MQQTIAPAQPGTWEHFAPYTPLHAAAVAVCAIAIAALIAAGRSLRGTDAERSLRRGFAWSCIVYWVSYNAWWHSRGIDWFNGLPLHICDLGGLIGPLALLTASRWLRATLYFWAFALTLQAFIQPALTAGPVSAVFWMFFLAHSIVLACALYDLLVLGFRPLWNDLPRVYGFSALYVAAVVPVNAWLGANYAYIGDPAPPLKIPPFIDALGPWPWRAVMVLALAGLSFPLLVLPWKLVQRRAAGR
ncbi:MAG: TIGR02206 family membrane protein [Pseudorhodoplanes sp.]|uniref:TMEM164-related integral membrane acyltransferase n=1 Tax=Pseudorhodoplanes sp. TaxID=1934341 RepID=UPI003D0A1DDF